MNFGNLFSCYMPHPICGQRKVSQHLIFTPKTIYILSAPVLELKTPLLLSPLPYRLSYHHPNLICKNDVIDWWHTGAVLCREKNLVSNSSGTFPVCLHVLPVYLHVLRFPPTVQRPKNVSGGYMNGWMDGDATNERWDHFPTSPSFCSCARVSAVPTLLCSQPSQPTKADPGFLDVDLL